MSDDADTIPLIGAGAAAPRDNSVRGGRGGAAVTGVAARVSVDSLRDQIARMTRIVTGPEFEADAPAKGGFAIDEIKLIAELTAGGELGFLVGGVDVEAKGAVEITFRRRT